MREFNATLKARVEARNLEAARTRLRLVVVYAEKHGVRVPEWSLAGEKKP